MPPFYLIEVVNIEHFHLIYKHRFIMKCDNKMILTTYYRKKGGFDIRKSNMDISSLIVFWDINYGGSIKKKLKNIYLSHNISE